MQPSNADLLLDPQSGVGAGLDGLPATRVDSLVSEAPSLAKTMLAGDVDDRADSHLIIRTVTAIMGCALRDHDDARVRRGIDSLSEIWRTGDPNAMYPIRTPEFEASLWERIAIELYALGAQSVLHERFAVTRELAGHEPHISKHYESWLRQGQVAGSRASTYSENVLELGARRLRELEPHLSADDALRAVCEFDLLSALVISERDPDGYYPNAAEFGEDLVEPLVIGKLREHNSPLRQHIYARDDPGLREALRSYDQKARTQAALVRRQGGDWKWRAYEDARTWVFINEGQILEKWERSAPTSWQQAT